MRVNEGRNKWTQNSKSGSSNYIVRGKKTATHSNWKTHGLFITNIHSTNIYWEPPSANHCSRYGIRQDQNRNACPSGACSLVLAGKHTLSQMVISASGKNKHTSSWVCVKSWEIITIVISQEKIRNKATFEQRSKGGEADGWLHDQQASQRELQGETYEQSEVSELKPAPTVRETTGLQLRVHKRRARHAQLWGSNFFISLSFQFFIYTTKTYLKTWS